MMQYTWLLVYLGCLYLASWAYLYIYSTDRTSRTSPISRFCGPGVRVRGCGFGVAKSQVSRPERSITPYPGTGYSYGREAVSSIIIRQTWRGMKRAEKEYVLVLYGTTRAEHSIPQSP